MDISLDLATKFYTWGLKGSVIGAAVTLIAIIFLVWGTAVRDRESEKEMAQTKLSAAQANERAEALRTDNLQIQTRLISAERDLESEKIERLKLQEITSWRRLTVEQAKAIADRIRPYPMKIIVSVVSGDPEPSVFANDLVQAFREGGADVQWSMRIGGPAIFGVVVTKTKNEDAYDLVSALLLGDVDGVEMANMHTSGAETADVVVGYKQRPQSENALAPKP